MGWKNDFEDTTYLLDDQFDNYGSVDARDKKKKPQENVAKISFFHLFKYATRFDITLMVIGTIFAIFSGMCYPILGFYFGGMTNVFINQAKNGLLPDEVAQRMDATAVTHAEPTKMVFSESTSPVQYTKDNQVFYTVVYTITEFFKGNLTNDDLWNNITDGPLLTETEFHSTLNKYLVIFLIMGTLTMISSFIQTMSWEYASEHQVHSIRKIYFSQILRQDISWYDKNEEGNLPNKLSDDLERMREGTGHKLVMIVQYLSTFFSGIAVGLYVNARMTLITLCIGPVVIGLTAYGARFTSTQVAREQQKYAKAGAVAEESLSNIKTVTAYSGQSFETRRYNDALEEGRIFAMKRYNALSVCIGLTFLSMYGAYGLGFWYGAGLVADGISSAGSVFTVFFSVIVGAFSIGQALPFLNIVAASVGVSSSIHEIINRKITIDPYSTTGRKPIRMEGHIEFRDVYFSYPSRPTISILNGLTLDILPGKTTAIVGSSGGGKSTIISLIQRLYDPSAGQVCVDGIAVTDLNVRWLRSHIGLVSQEPVLFGVSIAENISYGREDVTRDEIVEAAKQANAHDFITALPEQYDTLVGDTGSQLSGGQKQRIAIARALVRDPTILLLDEATSALDAHSEGIVQDTLTQVMVGRTTVIVAHRLSTIKNADIIYVMQAGRLYESGNHEELMAKQSLYYNLVMSQMSAKEEQAVVNEEYSDSSSQQGSIESEDELDRPTYTRTRFDTVAEEDNVEVQRSQIEEENSEAQRSQIEEENSEAQRWDEGQDLALEYSQTEDGKSTTTRNVLDEKVTKTTKIDEDGCEYEVIVIEQTVEELYDDDQEIQDTAVQDQKEKGDSEDEPEISDGLRRRSTRRRSSGIKKLTDSQRKKIPFIEPEPCEKEISVVQLLVLQKPEWGWLIFGILASVGVGMVTPIFALFYGQIFYVFTLEGEALLQARIFWTCMFGCLALFCGLVYSAQCKGLTESSEKTLKRLRALVFQNILRQPVAWFDFEASSPGILVNRLARNIPLIKAAAGVRTGQVLSALTTVVAAFSIAFLSGWKLSLTLIIFVPLVVCISYKQSVLLKKNQMKDALSMDLAGQVASETVRHIRTVQALGKELLFTQIYSNHLKAPYKEAVKQAVLYSILFASMQGIVMYMYAIAFRLGGYLVEIHEMETTNIYRVFFALAFCATSVGQSFMYLQDYNKARHATRILNYLLTRKSEIDPSNTAGVKPDLKGTVEFRRVQFVYPTRPDIRVLRRLTFKIEAGKTLALVGESGCGKSTVISLIERFHDPISGIILLDGYDIRTLNLNYLRSQIGIVNQEPILFDTSIRDNIAYGSLALKKEVTFEQIQDAAKTANIHDFVMTLPQRYDTIVGERGVQLSGGQKQRVAIARALIRDPKILLLDEATSALDTENEKIVQAALDRAKEGRTCIVVAHRLSTIQNADSICVVSKGEIVERGTHEELLEAKGHYFELTQRQVL